MGVGALMSMWRAGLVAVLGITLAPGASSAQATLTVTPSINLAVVSDSNLFAQPADPQSDVISRVSPAVAGEYRSERLTVLGRATVDAERFDRNTSLTTLQARSQGAIDIGYRATRRLVIDADASISTTETPGELNLVSGVSLTRAHASRLAASPSITYQHDAVTKGILTYSVTEDRLAGGVPTLAHVAAAAGERRWSRRDVARVDYFFREFDFGLEPTLQSHTVILGWTHELTRGATMSLGGGPRVADGTIVPELSAAVGYLAPWVDTSLAYARAQTTLIGLPGPVDTQSLTVGAAFGRRDSFHVRLAPGVMQTDREGLQARVYRVSLGASLPLGRALSVEAAYDFTSQHGDVYAGQADQIISRHVMVVSLAATTPQPRGVR